MLFFKKQNKSTSPMCLPIRDLTQNPLKKIGGLWIAVWTTFRSNQFN